MSEARRGEQALAPRGDLPALRRKLEDVRFADYFTILDFELDDALPADALDARYRSLRRRFDASRFVGHMGDEAVVTELEELRRGLEDAYEVLSDPVLRERYRKAIR